MKRPTSTMPARRQIQRNRIAARTLTGDSMGTPTHLGLHVTHPVDKKGVKLSLPGSGFYSPAYSLSKYIRDSLDPEKVRLTAARPVRTQSDMSEEEIAALEKQYGCAVKRG